MQDSSINASINDNFSLDVILEELSLGHIAVLTDKVREFIANKALYFSQLESYTPEDISGLKTLILICNITYNRTDMEVLPVEDGVYDLLLVRYSQFDPNFQVGSAVVQFQDKIEKEVVALEPERKAIDPFVWFKPAENEIKQIFRDNMLKTPSITHEEVFAIQDALIFEDDYKYIEKRTHNTKHNHPDLVGTLDKAKFVLDADAIEAEVYDDPKVTILERDFFVDHINRGIISPTEELELVIEIKYDGISVEADCTDEVVSARTRGDTGIGEAADITPILKGYKFYNNDVLRDKEVGVKFEAIMTYDNLYKFNIARGYNYKNCRTAIIGLFGASDAYLYRDFITLVPLALDKNDIEAPDLPRMEEINLLNRLYKTKGEPLRYVYIKGNYQKCLYMIKEFAEEALCARSYLGFMFDGLVISYLDPVIKEKLGRKNFINKYSIALKFNPMEKITKFLGYTFTVGQTGNICPMIHYSPVEFNGTIHPKSSGHSYNRFKELSLRYGDLISVVYQNDVMPYVNKYDCEANRCNNNPIVPFPDRCPVCNTPLVFTDKSAYCPNLKCDGRIIARTVAMLQKLNIKGFAESMMMSLNIYTFRDIIKVTKEEAAPLIGEINAINFVNAIQNLLHTPTEDYKLMGALGFTGCANATWKLIFKEMTLGTFVYEMQFNPEDLRDILLGIKGIGKGTVDTIFNEWEEYCLDVDAITKYCNVIDSGVIELKGQIRFTGCRDKDLEAELTAKGYDISGTSGVTKNTTILLVPYEGFTSTKTNKVSTECMIIPIMEFKQNMEKYL